MFAASEASTPPCASLAGGVREANTSNGYTERTHHPVPEDPLQLGV